MFHTSEATLTQDVITHINEVLVHFIIRQARAHLAFWHMTPHLVWKTQ